VFPQVAGGDLAGQVRARDPGVPPTAHRSHAETDNHPFASDPSRSITTASRLPCPSPEAQAREALRLMTHGHTRAKGQRTGARSALRHRSGPGRTREDQIRGAGRAGPGGPRRQPPFPGPRPNRRLAVLRTADQGRRPNLNEPPGTDATQNPRAEIRQPRWRHRRDPETPCQTPTIRQAQLIEVRSRPAGKPLAPAQVTGREHWPQELRPQLDYRTGNRG
jgi:hypothetical protein